MPTTRTRAPRRRPDQATDDRAPRAVDHQPHGRPLTGRVQRRPDLGPAGEPARAAIASMQSAAGNQAVQRSIRALTEAVASPVTGGEPLPLPTLAKMEHAFGADLGAVRVHPGGATHAHGYTRGQHVFLGQDEYRPGSRQGDQLLGHELAHVVQQSAGRVAPSHGFGASAPINLDPALEAEADQAGTRAGDGEAAGLPARGAAAQPAAIQGFWPVVVKILGAEAGRAGAIYAAKTAADKVVKDHLGEVLAAIGPKVAQAVLASDDLKVLLVKANLTVDLKDAAASLTRPIAAQLRERLSGMVHTPEALKQVEAEIERFEAKLRADLESTGLPALVDVLRPALGAMGVGALTEAGFQYIKSLGPQSAKDVLELARPMAQQMAEATAKPLVESVHALAEAGKGAGEAAAAAVDAVSGLPIAGSLEKAVGKYAVRPVLEKGMEAASIQAPTIDVEAVTAAAQRGVASAGDDALAQAAAAHRGLAGRLATGGVQAIPVALALNRLATAETALDATRAALQPVTSYAGGIAGGAAAGFLGAGPIGAAIGAAAGAAGFSTLIDSGLESVKGSVNPALEYVVEKTASAPVVGAPLTKVGQGAKVLLHTTNIVLTQVGSYLPFFGGGQASRDKAWSNASTAVNAFMGTEPPKEKEEAAAAPEPPGSITIDLGSLLDAELAKFSAAPRQDFGAEASAVSSHQ